MIYPKFIKENDLIGVPAPSNGAKNELKINKYNHAIKVFEDLGYKVLVSKYYLHSRKARSASAKKRAKEINEMFNNSNIDMIICASGGEFLVEILDYVNFDLIKKNPKYVVGFSDPTGLLYPITTKYDIATIYGSNFTSLGTYNLNKAQKDFLDTIKGNLKTLTSYSKYEEEYPELITGLEDSILNHDVYWKTLDNNMVEVSGRIIGGCIDIIAELAGTKYDGIDIFNEKYKDDGIIWYFDNCELTCEELIRTLWKLNSLGYFKYTKCIIFGRFGRLSSFLGYTEKSCLKDSIVSKLNIPIIYDACFSHKAPCMPVINGAIAYIKYQDGKAKVSYKLK